MQKWEGWLSACYPARRVGNERTATGRRCLELDFDGGGFDQVGEEEVTVDGVHGGGGEGNDVDGVEDHGEESGQLGVLAMLLGSGQIKRQRDSWWSSTKLMRAQGL
jgi:hypothetical protein